MRQRGKPYVGARRVGQEPSRSVPIRRQTQRAGSTILTNQFRNGARFRIDRPLQASLGIGNSDMRIDAKIVQ